MWLSRKKLTWQACHVDERVVRQRGPGEKKQDVPFFWGWAFGRHLVTVSLYLLWCCCCVVALWWGGVLGDMWMHVPSRGGLLVSLTPSGHGTTVRPSLNSERHQHTFFNPQVYCLTILRACSKMDNLLKLKLLTFPLILCPLDLRIRWF